MVLLCKQKALYVKGCIIANGITDSQGDTLYSEDIKKIFTSFNNQVYHNDLPIQEVSLLENYISTADETIGTQIIPRGSWNCVIRVDNPEIQEGLLTGEFGGLSLNNRIAPKCKGNLSGQVRYQDIPDAECIIPLLISFVERGANGYGLHVMDYTAYIKKSNSSKGAKSMAFNLLDGLKSLIKEAEASEKEEAVILKSEEDEATEEVEQVEEALITDSETEEKEEPIVQKEDTTEEEPVIEKADTTEEDPEEDGDEEEEPEIEKADDSNLEERVAKLEELVQQLLPKEETDEEGESEDTPKITKSEKVIVEDTSTINNTNYYEMTGRDPITGVKIRKESKIL